MTTNHPQFGLMCEICFSGLTPEQCAVDVDGQAWDVCAGECARQAGIQEQPAELGTDVAPIPLVSLASTVTAEKVTVKAVKLVACSRCGRGPKLRRTKTITEVLRPLDRPASVLAFMKLEAEDWRPVAEHPPCKCAYYSTEGSR